jgi:hypothetical protein
MFYREINKNLLKLKKITTTTEMAVGGEKGAGIMLAFFQTSIAYIHQHPNFDLGIYIAPTQPFRAAPGAEIRVCYPGNTADRQTQ